MANAPKHEFRPAESADLEFLFGLHELTQRDIVDSIWGWDEEDQRRRFEDHFRPGEIRILVVEGMDVGFTQVAADAGFQTLHRIAIHPLYQGRGLGSEVMDRLQEQARRAGLRFRVQSVRNEEFLRFCEHRGFTVESLTTTHFTMIDRSEEDRRWMGEALAEARRAAEQGEAPIGAVIVRDGAIVGRGHNRPLGASDPTAHAEMVAIRQAAAALERQRLTGCEAYVTIEPCAMCAGAILHARLSRLVFGAHNEKFGACGSVLDLLGMSAWNHRVVWRGNVRDAEAAALMLSFFRERRGSVD